MKEKYFQEKGASIGAKIDRLLFSAYMRYIRIRMSYYRKYKNGTILINSGRECKIVDVAPGYYYDVKKGVSYLIYYTKDKYFDTITEKLIVQGYFKEVK